MGEYSRLPGVASHAIRSTPRPTRRCTRGTRRLAKAEPRTVFGGRLGTYKYYDMHNVIDTALTAYEEQVEPLLKK